MGQRDQTILYAHAKRIRDVLIYGKEVKLRQKIPVLT